MNFVENGIIDMATVDSRKKCIRNYLRYINPLRGKWYLLASTLNSRTLITNVFFQKIDGRKIK